jgi:putative redox protein
MTHDTLRRIELKRGSDGLFRSVNARGGELVIGASDAPDFTPVELLLTAIGACTALDVDAITGKRAERTSFDVVVEGNKVRDDGGNHLVDLTVTLSVRFPDDESGDAAREVLPRAIRQSADRLCTVGRTVQLGTPIEYVQA